MNDQQVKNKTHFSVWIVGVLSLIWHLMGCANYIWQMNMGEEAISAMTEAQSAIINGRPAWATAGFAIAVFGGAIGSILLLLRKASALIFFALALLGVIVSMIPVFGLVGSGVTFSAFEKTMYLIMTPIVGAFLVWFTRYAIRSGWIGSGPRHI